MKKLGLLLGLWAAMLSCQNVMATHLSGGEISWKSIHKDTLKVFVTVYRECGGTNLYNAPLKVTSTCGTTSYATVRSGGVEMLPLCSSYCSPCDQPSSSCTYSVGIQKWKMTAIVPLKRYRDSSCCELSLSWILCCRSNNISTGGANADLYLHARLNVCDSTMNNVSWHPDLLGTICLGRDLESPSFNLRSQTPDDSIVYSFIPAQEGTRRTMTYTAPYAYDKPVYFLGFPKGLLTYPRGIHLDQHTGMIRFRPMKEELATICVRSEIFRNGRSVGYTIRDQYVRVIKCPNNNNPVLSGIDCKDDFDFHACVGEPIEFNICSSDKDKRDSVILRWINEIPGSSITIINKGDLRETARFSWTPQLADVRQQPHEFVVMAEDDACPVKAQTGQVFTITVDEPKEAVIDTIQQQCGTFLFYARSKNINRFEQFDWTIDGMSYSNAKTAPSIYDTVQHTFYQPGFHPISIKTLAQNRCALYAEDSIEIPDSFLWIERPERPDIECPDDSVTLQLVAHTKKGTPTIAWDTHYVVSADTGLYTVKYAPSWRTVYYSVTDSTCNVSGQVAVIGYTKNYVKIPSYLKGCWGADSFVLDPFSSSSSPYDSITSFRWTDTFNNTLSTDSTLTVKDSSVYLLHTTSIRGCEYRDAFKAQLLKPTFKIPNDTATCYNETPVLRASSKEPGSFTWTIAHPNQPASVIQNTSVLKHPIGHPAKVIVQFTESYGYRCSASDSFLYDTLGLPDAVRISHPDKACKEDSITVTASSDSAIWQLQNHNYYGSHLQIPIKDDRLNQNKYSLQLTAINAAGCKKDSQTSIYLYKKPAVSFSLKDSVRTFENYQPSNTSPDNPNHLYLWEVGPPLSQQYTQKEPNFYFSSMGLYEVSLTITDTFTDCKDSYSDSLKVFQYIDQWSPIDRALEIYPNPASAKLHIHWRGKNGFEARITNLQGKELSTQRTQGEQLDFTVTDLDAGCYFIEIRQGESFAVRRIEIL